MKQRALAGAVGADQAPHLSTLHHQGNVRDGGESPKALGEAADREHAHGFRSRVRNPKIPAGITNMTAIRMTPTTTSQVSSKRPRQSGGQVGQGHRPHDGADQGAPASQDHPQQDQRRSSDSHRRR